MGRTALLSFVALGTIAGLAGCGGAGSVPPLNTTPQPTSVIFAATPPSSLAVNASATIDAATIYATAVGIGSQNSLVTYSISCGSPNACGALSASDEVGAVVYTAPAAIPAGGTVTVTATSVAKPSLSASTTITIVPPIPISVSFYGTPPASLQVNASFTLRALIVNDVTANPQVKWSVACGGTACGSVSPVTTGNDVATTYTAPSAIPPGSTVTVTVTSVTDPTKSASATILITAAAPMLANGAYVFQISGYAADGAGFVTGVLVAQNGVITGGEQDSIYDNGDGPYSYFQQITGGSYATTPDGNLEISIQSGQNALETLNGTLVSGQKGYVAGIEGIRGNGTLELQTGKPAPSGGYAISLGAGSLYDSSPSIDGILDVDSAGGISGTGSILDVNAAGAYYSGVQTVGASTVSAPDAYGRVLFQLNPGLNSGLPALNIAGYVVDATHIRLMAVGNANNGYYLLSAMGETALAQGANTGKFSAATLAGTSYVFGAQGEDQLGALQLAGVLTLNAGGSATGTLNWNDLHEGAQQNPLAFAGTYMVDPTGRVTLTNLADGATFKYSLHLYLGGNGEGLILSNDGNDVFAGQAFQRQAGAFTAASFSGNYGMNASLSGIGSNGSSETENVVGPLAVVSNSSTESVTGFADGGAGTADFLVSGSFAAAPNGVFNGTLAGFDGTSPSTANTFTLYMVDSTQGIFIETDDAQLVLGRVAQ